MALGLLAIIFPTVFGNMMIGSVAFFIAIPSILSFILFLLVEKYRFVFISFVFFLMSLKIMQQPSTLLFYLGWTLMFLGVINFFTNRRKGNALISASVVTIFGVFCVLNARAAMNTSMIILGASMFLLGGYIYLSTKSFVENDMDVFPSHRKSDKKFHIQQTVKKTKHQKMEEFEEAEFEEIE